MLSGWRVGGESSDNGQASIARAAKLSHSVPIALPCDQESVWLFERKFLGWQAAFQDNPWCWTDVANHLAFLACWWVELGETCRSTFQEPRNQSLRSAFAASFYVGWLAQRIIWRDEGQSISLQELVNQPLRSVFATLLVPCGYRFAKCSQK